MKNKITLHKNAYKHNQLTLVLKQLRKAVKQIDSQEVYLQIELTGVEEEDWRRINYHLKDKYNYLNKEITEDINRNHEDNEGFYFLPRKQMILFLEQMKQALDLVSNYPVLIPKTITIDFEPNTTGEARRVVISYRLKLVDDRFFNTEYYMVSEGKEKRIYPMTYSHSDLEAGNQMIIKYL